MRHRRSSTTPGGRQGSPAGTSRSALPGRRAPQEHQVHLALPGREPAGQAPTTIGSPKGHEPEGGQGLGHEGKSVRVVALPQRWLG